MSLFFDGDKKTMIRVLISFIIFVLIVMSWMEFIDNPIMNMIFLGNVLYLLYKTVSGKLMGMDFSQDPDYYRNKYEYFY